MRRIFLFTVLLAFGQQVLAAPKVLSSIQPLHLIAQSILGEEGESDVLLPAGASPHSFSLRPSDSKHFAEADVFFWIGPGMENFLGKLVERRPEHSHAMQSLSGLELLYFTDEHEHEHKSGELKEHDHYHPPGGLDAHLWLSSQNARVMADFMAETFARLNPAVSGYYQQNLDAFNRELDALDQELQILLRSVRGKPFFVFHEAFNYLERTYRIPHRGVFAMSAEVQPGARHVQQMREALEQAGPSCIFTEPPAPPRLAQSLVKDLPVKLQELDALGIHAESYPEMLRNIVTAMHGCLSSL